MTDAARIAALEAALADVQARLDPQRLAQSMEFVWQPRGGEPRIVDSAGNTLDYTPAIQFLNATTELDVPAQRVVVTPTGGSGSATYRFSDDISPTAADEKIVFEAESGPATPHMFLGGYTFGTTRAGVLAVAEDVSDPAITPDAPAAALGLVVDATAGQGSASLAAAPPAGGSSADLSLTGTATGAASTLSAGSTTGAPNNRAAVSCQAIDPGVGPRLTVRAETSASGQGPADVQVASESFDTSGAAVAITATQADTGESTRFDLTTTEASVKYSGGTKRTLIDAADGSSYVQLDGIGLRRIRGPFAATPGGGIGPLGTGSAVVNAALFGASQAVFGGVSSAAGDEACAWSWQAGPGANQVTISFTNLLSAGLALLPTLTFMTICDA